MHRGLPAVSIGSRPFERVVRQPRAKTRNEKTWKTKRNEKKITGFEKRNETEKTEKIQKQNETKWNE
jgi:hypothetical protein